jgi:hypothetical protein
MTLWHLFLKGSELLNHFAKQRMDIVGYTGNNPWTSKDSESEQTCIILIFEKAIICSHLQPLAQAATSGCRLQMAASGCKWLQVAACGGLWLLVVACDS